MPQRLTIALADPATFPGVLHDAWRRGDAVMPLPVDGGAARILAAITAAPTATGDLPASIDLDAPEDSALIVATSGSTGEPKGVVLTHRALAASTTASIARLDARPGERFTLALPLHHVAGIQVLLRSWACGTDAEVVTAGDVQGLATAIGEHVSMVPAQLARLVAEAPGTLARWRSILVGGAALDGRLEQQARAADASIVLSYGMTETAGGCVYDGRPLDGVEVSVVEGRIAIDGGVLCAGYLLGGVYRPRPPGPLMTEDLGRVDERGTLTVIGRADDVVISGGENVPSTAVAARLREHDAVSDAAVFGMPSRRWGQRVTAAVVPSDAGGVPDPGELTAWTRAVLPRSWAPRVYVVTTSIPRTALGKPDLPALRRLAHED